MSNSWDHLPNAKYINLILDSLNDHRQEWEESWEEYTKLSEYNNGRWILNSTISISWRSYYDNLSKVQEILFQDVRDRLEDCFGNDRLVYSAEYALLALFTDNDCTYMFDSDISELRLLSTLGSHAATLMVPSVIAFKLINAKTEVML